MELRRRKYLMEFGKIPTNDKRAEAGQYTYKARRPSTDDPVVLRTIKDLGKFVNIFAVAVLCIYWS